ncbi:hypothetical protein J6590_059669 [Homalodisca vitripennis]|nr:hypothetical protein J6590_059669 [Homalodisca vitripennis]
MKILIDEISQESLKVASDNSTPHQRNVKLVTDEFGDENNNVLSIVGIGESDMRSQSMTIARYHLGVKKYTTRADQKG